ncbi:Zn(II)2Cys6 transcription factor domain-containing protein [Aspergillus undulatus]|uniref:Zn(II)2Cys6 transcription factor domain-containing protein n=1 Tax=Aspergillus undulatus TaxID=1810928 RepID=UPI003CCD6945
MTPTVNDYAQRTSRKTHKKSRLGCGNCKKRRIKCDERKPSCRNCIRHCIECDYAHTPSDVKTPTLNSEKSTLSAPNTHDSFTFISSSQTNFAAPKRAHRKRVDLAAEPAQQSPTSTSSSVSAATTTIANKPFQFTATDLALFHHFMSCPELGAEQPQWQTQMTRWGFQHHFLLHLFLALSGFHLARNPNALSHLQGVTGQDIDYVAEAERHYDAAVHETASAVPHITGCNGQIIYTAAVFIFICSLARGPRPGEYLGFRDDGDVGCLSLFMGVRSVLELCSHVLSVDVATSHIQSESVPDDGPQPGSKLHHSFTSLSPETPDLTEHDHLERLRSLLNHTYPLDQSTHLEYGRVLDRLKQTYSLVHPAPDSPLQSLGLFPHVFGWLYTLPDVFLSDIIQQQQLALTFFSFFAVLMKDVDAAWFIRGWPEHIMQRIWQILDPYHRQFAAWPMRELGYSVFNPFPDAGSRALNDEHRCL